jgi:site-specific recombinase XerD
LEDGVNIITVQKLMGHQNIESTLVYLHCCHLPDRLPTSPLDKVFTQCSKGGK